MSSRPPWARGVTYDTVKLDLIDTLYSASTDPKRWPLFMDRISHWFAGHAAMFVVDRRAGPSVRFLGGNLDSDRMRSHDEYYGARCPWPARLGASGSVVDVSERLHPVEDLVRTEYYNDWLKPQAQHHWLGIHPDAAGDRTLHLGVGRAEKRGSFGGEEERFFIELAPHLSRVIDIARRLDLLDKQASATALVLDGLRAGVLLVEADGTIAFANSVAEQLLRGNDGLTVRNGRLRATGLMDGALRAAIGAAALPGPGRAGTTLSLPRTRADLPLSALIGPLAERDAPMVGTGPLAMVLLGAPELDVGFNEDSLRAVYDLTPAEARLAAALCAGQSLADHADAAGVSINTVKYHLKSIFGKTGDTRQPELVRRLLADPVLRLAN